MVEQKPKTKVYSIVSTFDHSELGKVLWYGKWRQYTFEPTINGRTVWSFDCLKELIGFIEYLKKQRFDARGKRGAMKR